MEEERGISRFENTSNCGEVQVSDFNRVFLKPVYIKLGIAIIFSFALLSLSFFFGFDEPMLGWSMACAGLVFTLIMPLTYKKVMKNSLKQNKLFSSTTFSDFSFEDEGVRLKTRKGDVEIASAALDYRHFDRVVENDRYIYLFFTPSMAYILEKSGMTEGKSDDLSEFLKSKISRYKRLKK